jgi:hypothetical protein
MPVNSAVLQIPAQSPKSYGDRDLIHLTKAALIAHSKIVELMRQDRAEDLGDQPGDGCED